MLNSSKIVYIPRKRKSYETPVIRRGWFLRR